MQFSIDRHNNTDFGRASTSAKTVAPVVLRPEVDSNSALLKLPVTPETKNGTAPRRINEIQLIEVSR